MATETAQPSSAKSLGSTSVSRSVLRFIGKYGTLIFLLGMVIIFSVLRPNVFPTPSNLLLVLNSIALVAIISGGLTMVLVVGEFDLSIGSLASLAGIIGVSLIVAQGLPVPVALLFGLSFGALVGLFNATIVTKAGVNALVATLGTGSVLIGLNYIITSGRPLAIRDDFFSSIALGKVLFGIPNLVVIMAIVYVILWVILNRTDLGFQMQAVGGNKEAARMSGILIDRVKMVGFAISGICAALAGMLLSSRLGSGQVAAGEGYLLDAFAACFLGSAVLRDGQFHIVGTFFGALTVGVGFAGILMFGLPTYIQLLFRGGLLIGAVALATIARRYARA
jgi:ribose transport system permease protein